MIIWLSVLAVAGIATLIAGQFFVGETGRATEAAREQELRRASF